MNDSVNFRSFKKGDYKAKLQETFFISTYSPRSFTEILQICSISTQTYTSGLTSNESLSSLTRALQWPRCLARTTAGDQGQGTLVVATSTTGTNSMRASQDTFTIARRTEGAAAQMARSVSSIKDTWRAQATRASWSGIRFTLETSTRKVTMVSIFPSAVSQRRLSSFTIRLPTVSWGSVWVEA